MIGSKKLIARSRSLSLTIVRAVSHDSCGHTSRNRSSSFITKGYQPTTRELLDDCKHDALGSMNASVDEARVLPILDASVILSPGQYCKNDSKSGTVAAQKLVDGRRAFGEVMTKELLGFTNSDKGKYKDHVRKLYALSGHGVPNSLFEHFISMGREWLRCHNAVSSSANNLHIAKPVSSLKSPPQSPSSAIHLALRNIPNCTIFDREKILKTNASGTTSLIQWPVEWDHDLELYMVVMNRIGSRLSSIVLKQDVSVSTILTNDDNMSSGSVIIPSHLNKWNVSIRKGEIIPYHLMPTSGKYNDLVLTVEWLYNSVDCWTIVLRLQDDFVDRHAAYKGLIKDPIALVFEGVYVAT